MSKSRHELLAQYKRAGLRDYVGLWEVVAGVSALSEHRGDTQTEVLNFVRLMLKDGFIAGFPTGHEFKRWPNQEADYVVQRVHREWGALGRQVGVGDIVWFDVHNSLACREK